MDNPWRNIDGHFSRLRGTVNIDSAGPHRLDKQRKNGDYKVNSQQIVYAALLDIGWGGPGILGLYSKEEDAITRCLKEPTLVRCEWILEGTHNWSNGAGRYVKVKKYVVE